MGIDLSFSDKSLIKSKYALCRKYMKKVIKVYKDGSKSNEWDNLGYEEQNKICAKCPICPIEDTNCYVRFSNYPSMASFRTGFIIVIAWAKFKYSKPEKDNLFSGFVDKAGYEYVKDLIKYCEGAKLNKGAEALCNTVMDTLKNMDFDKISGGKIPQMDIPWIDEVISKLIYREKNYTKKEIKKVLPLIEKVVELASNIMWDLESKELRNQVQVFKVRMEALLTMLRIAKRYDLEIYVSY